MYTDITNQEIDLFFGYLQQSASKPFVELCFEAGNRIARLYLSWVDIPQGCA